MLKMFRKRFYVRVDLQLHAITCPGVWLCTHGYVEATIKALGYYFRTGAMEPRFPLLCHDQFTMEGYFKTVNSLAELEQVLAAEKLEVTLWQNGRRLAYFTGNLADVMHPTLPRLSCEHNINVQLLMKATPAFPGIIAPKVELSAEVAVQDRLENRRNSVDSYCSRNCTLDKLKPTRLVLDSKQLPRYNRHSMQSSGSSCSCSIQEKRKQMPVCHAKLEKCSAYTCCPTSNDSCGGSSFEADYVAHKNDLRRLSTCSSLLSTTNTNTLSQTASCTNTSDCFHSLSTTNAGSKAYSTDSDDHHRNCEICQEYQRTFHKRYQ